MDTLKNQVAALIEGGKYEKASNLVANELGIKLDVISHEYGKHFYNDTQERYIFKLKLSKGGEKYTFNFGQSIAKGAEEPTLYDVLACLQKYDVGTVKCFAADYGYTDPTYYKGLDDKGIDKEIEKVVKVYKAVCREYAAMQRLFTDEELEILSEIN
jgi:hypothetical protein